MLFGRLTGRNDAEPEEVMFPVKLTAPCVGEVVPMERIGDLAFSQGMLGHCCGVEPESGEVYAPCDGRITFVADTSHAVSMEIAGIELLIHVGIDTVGMNGEGFFVKVQEDQTVKAGEMLMTMDIAGIRAAEHAATVIMAVTNSAEFDSVRTTASGRVQTGDNLMIVDKT